MTLTKNDLKRRLNPKQESGYKPIVITPIFDLDDQLGISGFDVRLGKQFIVFREHFKESFSPSFDKLAEHELRKYQEEIIVPFKKSITLHPGKFIIGSTFEYVSIPPDLECQVEGRSSWARLGLIVATATTVEPCYKGVITLELSNNGTMPIKLFPGIKIAQLIFHKTSEPYKMVEPESEKKKYNLSIGPGFSQAYKDKYINYFCENKKNGK